MERGKKISSTIFAAGIECYHSNVANQWPNTVASKVYQHCRRTTRSLDYCTELFINGLDETLCSQSLHHYRSLSLTLASRWHHIDQPLCLKYKPLIWQYHHSLSLSLWFLVCKRTKFVCLLSMIDKTTFGAYILNGNIPMARNGFMRNYRISNFECLLI